MREHARGVILGMVLVIALVGSIASYGILQIALNQSLHAEFHHERTRSRYAAEIGVVWAQQQLWADAAWCGGTYQPPEITPSVDVAVTVTNCGAGNPHAIRAEVIY